MPYARLLQVCGNRPVPRLQTVCTSRCGGWLGGPAGTQSWLPAWRRTQCSCGIRNILCAGTETLSLPPPGAGSRSRTHRAPAVTAAPHSTPKSKACSSKSALLMFCAHCFTSREDTGMGQVRAITAADTSSWQLQQADKCSASIRCARHKVRALNQPNTEVTSAHALRAGASQQQSSLSQGSHA